MVNTVGDHVTGEHGQLERVLVGVGRVMIVRPFDVTVADDEDAMIFHGSYQ
jgi:hypothetical protein